MAKRLTTFNNIYHAAAAHQGGEKGLRARLPTNISTMTVTSTAYFGAPSLVVWILSGKKD